MTRISNINSGLEMCLAQTFFAVFGVVAALVRFVVDECLHADWDERMPVVVMVAVYVCIG